MILGNGGIKNLPGAQSVSIPYGVDEAATPTELNGCIFVLNDVGGNTSGSSTIRRRIEPIIEDEL